MKDLLAIVFSAIIVIAFIIVMATHEHPEKTDRTAKPKIPIFYQYEIITACDTVRFGTQEKCFLSERNNVIDIQKGEIQYENVKSIRLVQTTY